MNYAVSRISPEIISQPHFKIYTDRHFDQIKALDLLPDEIKFEIKVVANILPFRVNQYVIDTLIDWSDPLNDPMFILTFPQKEMVAQSDFERMASLIKRNAGHKEIQELAKEIRSGFNPHPAGQMELNVPEFENRKLEGMQHKYRETLLFFPSQGQVCHSYCTFCFRWAQFVGDKTMRFASSEADLLYGYLRRHQEITDLLITGGDPMVMKTHHLSHYLQNITAPEYVHVQNIRIGTKALTYWPHRFVTDADADDLLRLFERLVNAGKHVAVMAHVNHWRELESHMTRKAIQRIRSTGAEIRCQSPLLAHINDDADVWSTLWRMQVKLGMYPYYMFMERDTGARRYFEVPIVRAWEIYREAIQNVSGLARTARGPSMSSGPGKIEIQGVTEINGEKLFVFRFIQGRNEDWVQRPFFARYDENATWFSDLQPAFGEQKYFFEDEYTQMLLDKNAFKLMPN